MAKTQKQLEDAIQECASRWLKDRGIPARGGLTPQKDVSARIVKK
jgi:hypothetical protein